MIALGIEEFTAAPPAWLRGRRLGLLCNQASVTGAFVHARDCVERALPGQLSCLLSPQHGFFADKQDNMIESPDDRDGELPIFSLYGETRRPTAGMLDRFDVLLVDLVDVGTRVYTFMSTLAYCLEECGRAGKPVVVLDRPNPLGGEVMEGAPLKPAWRSFVGLFPIPMRHGLTFGELARFINRRLPAPAELTVIPMRGWRRKMLFGDTGLPWIYPSPNLPTITAALVYPGLVVLEGTNVSEGRGTAMPFELFGAPWLDPRPVAGLPEAVTGGCVLRPVAFEPTANKWAGTLCRGFQIHVTDPHVFRPYRLGLALLQILMRTEGFALKEPPYEYEYEKTPLDLILGDGTLRGELAAGGDLLEIEASWGAELEAFAAERAGVLLYD